MTSLVAKALLIAILASSLQLVVAVDSGLCAEQKKCINPGAQSCTPEGKRVVCVTRSNDNGCPGNGPSDMPSDVCTWTREGGTGVVEFNWAVGWATKYCFEVENDQEVLFFMRGDRECDGEAEIDMRWSSGLQHGTAKCHASNGSLCKHWTFPESFYQDNAVKYAEAYNWKTNADGQYKPTSPSLPQGCVWRIKVRGCPVPDVRTCSDLDTGIHCPGCYEDVLNAEYVDCDNSYASSLKKNCAPDQPCMTGAAPQQLTKAECELRCLSKPECRYFSSYEDRDCLLHFTSQCDNPEHYPDTTVTRKCPLV